MIPTMKLILTLATVLGIVLITINSTSHKGRKSGNKKHVDNFAQKKEHYKNAARKALDAIGSNRTLSASNKQVKQGHHVFNKGLLKFHRSVLKDLLEDVGGCDELENLVKDLTIPLDQTERNAISTMVARFSSKDGYVDFNADVFGEYVRELRKTLVEYLKADTSVYEGGRKGIKKKRKRVLLIANQAVNHEVYVDPMARDHWQWENRNQEQVYNRVRDKLKTMFQNILEPFQNVSVKIKILRRGNNLNRDRSDLK